ncbi:prolyl oligopeptidase family serine peptidase [candidate division GN15 bacterium]|nr:prolyl oligopeptidase family serine peptidase [candidate division GN15 bacterium]
MNRVAILSVALAIIAIGSPALSQSVAPPPTPPDTVVDTIHGVEVVDPYRWLENGADPDVQAWTEAQYRYFRAYVETCPGRDELAQRITDLMAVGSIDAPRVRGRHYFWKERQAGQDHAVLYTRRGLAGEPRVLLDPNTFSDDGTVALDWWYLSPDGSLLVYGTSSSGSELSTLYLMRTDTGEPLADTIPYTQFASIAWRPDNAGFYYSRFPTPGSVPEGESQYYRRIYYHELGTAWEDDPLIFGEELGKADWPSVTISPDGHHLFVVVYIGGARSQLYYLDVTAVADTFRLISGPQDALFSVEPLDDRFYVYTNHRAPNYKVYRGSYVRPDITNWWEVIDERGYRLESIRTIAGHLIGHYLENVSSRLELFTARGAPVTQIDLPTIGSVKSIYGEPDGSEMFFLFQSFNHPPTVYRYDFEKEALEVRRQLDVDIDFADFEVNLVRYKSRDSTPISMFLVGPAGAARDSARPTLLYGYGGFNVSQKPYFSKTLALWFEQGGLFAVPHLRGGGEYGEAWHRAGMLEHKQNTFDDFIAAADYLVAEGYTSREQLAIQGGSNGGLLIGAVLTQRPDLCRAALCQVPLLDMVRYHEFLVARLWVPEYGSAEDPEQFAYLYEYSPYHNVTDSTAYPAVLITSALSDTRVDPMHARKFAARLQAANAAETPILLRIETKAGHGAGKPTSQYIVEATDRWSFLFKALGLSVDSPN